MSHNSRESYQLIQSCAGRPIKPSSRISYMVKHQFRSIDVPDYQLRRGQKYWRNFPAREMLATPTYVMALQNRMDALQLSHFRASDWGTWALFYTAITCSGEQYGIRAAFDSFRTENDKDYIPIYHHETINDFFGFAVVAIADTSDISWDDVAIVQERLGKRGKKANDLVPKNIGRHNGRPVIIDLGCQLENYNP